MSTLNELITDEFNAEREKSILSMFPGFSSLVPRDSHKYYDALLDHTFRHSGSLDASSFDDLVKHSILSREDSSERFNHYFFDRYLFRQLTSIEDGLKRLADKRYTFHGTKRVITQRGVLARVSASDIRDYTSIVCLENLNSPSSIDEEFKFELISNGRQHVTGQLLFSADFSEYVFGPMVSVQTGDEAAVDTATGIKVLQAVRDMLKTPEYEYRKSTHHTNNYAGRFSSVHVIDLNDVVKTTLPFRYSTFSREDLNQPGYTEIRNQKIEKFSKYASEINEEPIYGVYSVHINGDSFSSVSKIGKTTDLETLDKYIRIAATEQNRALVTYEQGWQGSLTRIIEGKGPGTSPAPHIRRLVKKKGDGYVVEPTFVGRKSDIGKRIYTSFVRLKETFESVDDFRNFLKTEEGIQYKADFKDLSEMARDARMSEDNIGYMEVALGIHHKDGKFSYGFESKEGPKNVQVFRSLVK